MKTKNHPTPPQPITIADLERLSGGAIATDVTPRPKKVKKKPARKDTRYRCQFRFWLDANKPDQVQLGEALADLKRQRRYLPTLRNAIRLFLDLRAGRTDVLFELFPWIVERLKTTPAPDSGDLEARLEVVVKASVQAAMMNMPSLPATDIVAAPLKQSGNFGQGKAVVAPAFDDDDGDTLVIKESKKTSNYENMMASLFKADDLADRLYAERLAAGEIDPRTGRWTGGTRMGEIPTLD